jgi:hypothetical protein
MYFNNLIQSLMLSLFASEILHYKCKAPFYRKISLFTGIHTSVPCLPIIEYLVQPIYPSWPYKLVIVQIYMPA